jgi:hypothetical protein
MCLLRNQQQQSYQTLLFAIFIDCNATMLQKLIMLKRLIKSSMVTILRGVVIVGSILVLCAIFTIIDIEMMSRHTSNWLPSEMLKSKDSFSQNEQQRPEGLYQLFS